MSLRRYATLQLSFASKVFVVLLLLGMSLVGVYFLYQSEHAFYERQLSDANARKLDFMGREVASYFYHVAEDLHVIAGSTTLLDFINEPTESNRLRLLQDFRSYSQYKQDYAQLRYLDKEGEELLRVESGGQVVHGSQLQDKAERYYFKEGMAQKSGFIYVSPIDLNVEQGTVQEPYVPMIRFVLPIDDPVRGRLGVLVLNYDATALLKNFQAAEIDELWQLEVLNSEGYWVLNKRKELEWGFMLADRGELTLSQQAPGTWAAINQQVTGYVADGGGALFWHRLELENSTNFRYGVDSKRTGRFWVLGARYDAEAWSSVFFPIRLRFLFGAAVLVLCAGFFLAYSKLRERNQAEINAMNWLNAKILKTAQVAVISTDSKGQVTTFNDFAEELLGWSADELVGKQNATMFDEAFQLAERAEELSVEAGRTIAADFEVFSYPADRDGRFVREWLLTCKDGSKVPVILAVSPIKNSAGATTGYLTVGVDIREQKKVEAALLEARENAEGLVRMKSQFLANMSHEIRTPMNGVIGLSNLLLIEDLSPEQRSLAQVIVNSAEVLMLVINDILDFSKIEAGSMSLDEVPFDLREVIDNTLMLYSPQADANQVELVNRADPYMHYAFFGDPQRVTQVLSNLVGNAVKFTEQGEIVLSVATRTLSKEKCMVRFEVSDTGIGMSQEVQDRIFQPFVQADASTTRQFGGAGLGLAITTQLIEMMGGTIEVESEVGHGTTFIVEIPMLSDSEKLRRYDRSLAQGFFEGKRALILDDNLTNLLVLDGQLKPIGFDVDTFQLPDNAFLEFVNNPDYDLLILDYLMPEVDGLELAARLKPYRDPKRTKLVVLSSSQASIPAEQRALAGIDAYLTKPISQRMLQAAIIDLFKQEQPRVLDPVQSDSESLKKQLMAKIGEHPLKIILADDDNTNREVIKLQLQSLGLQVVVVESGPALLKRLDDEPFNVIFLDCNMPKMDGYEVARIIREREARGEYYKYGQRLRIIAATAFAFEQDRERCIEVGMDDYVAKPIYVSDLAGAIERSLSSS